MLVVRVLAVCEGIVEDLVFPHVQIENHNDEDDPVIKPFPRDADVSPGEMEVKVPCVETWKFNVQTSVKVREVPVLW